MKMDGGLENNPRPLWHEVVRYAPWNYNDDGTYKFWRTEWSRYCDVEDAESTTPVTAREYLYWERAYIATFIAIVEKAGISNLIVKDLCGSDIGYELRNGLPLPRKGIRNLRAYLKSIKEGKRIRRDGFELIVALMLRCAINCSLTNDDDSFILEVGEYFYMYIRTILPEETIRNIADRYNMFVNPRSPSFPFWLSGDSYETHIREGMDIITVDNNEEGECYIKALNHSYYPYGYNEVGLWIES